MEITISAGETLSGYVFSAGQDVGIQSGGELLSSVLLSGAEVDAEAKGAVVSALTVSSGAGMLLADKSRAVGVDVMGGVFSVQLGSARHTTVGFGGQFYGGNGATDLTRVSAGGYFNFTEEGGGGSAYVASGATIRSGGELVVSQGTLLGAALNSGATAVVGLFGGLGGTVSAGATVVVQDGVAANLSGLVAQSGGTVVLLGKGTETGLDVQSGGTLEQGDVVVFAALGAAEKVVQFAATSLSGNLVGVGKDEIVVGGGSAVQTAVALGGTLTLSSGGESTSAVVAGLEQVLSGGQALGTTIKAGGLEAVSGRHALASGTTIRAGGVLSTTLSATASATTVESGGVAILGGGYVNGVTAQAGGVVNDFGGFVSNVTIGSGAQLVLQDLIGKVDNKSAGTVAGVVSAGGTLVVLPGFNPSLVASGLNLKPGATVVDVNGAALTGETGQHSATIVSASVVVLAPVPGTPGGTQFAPIELAAYGTALSGGTLAAGSREYVYSGGTASDTTVGASAFQLLSAGAALGGTIASGGVQEVGFSAIVSGVTIDSGGLQSISGLGSVIANETVLNGGTILAGLNAAQFDGLTISAGGFAQVGDSVDGSVGTLTDVLLYAGGTLDLNALPYVSGGSAILNGADVLAITDGTQSFTIQLVGNYAGEAFHLGEDGRGGTLVTLSAASEASSHAMAGGELVPGGAQAANTAAHMPDRASVGAGYAGLHATAAESFPISLPHLS